MADAEDHPPGTRLRVTRKDVEDAILIGEILGGHDEAFHHRKEGGVSCLVNEMSVPVREDHCPSCTCTSQERGDCGHGAVWQCITAALGASAEAEMLWMWTSNAISDLSPDARECDKAEPKIRRWILSLASGRSRDRAELNFDLEAAALLRDGLLLPGVVLLVDPRRGSPRSRRGPGSTPAIARGRLGRRGGPTEGVAQLPRGATADARLGPSRRGMSTS
jgi:hypothetical protein